MGREIRKVKPGWSSDHSHFDEDYQTAADEWLKNCTLWTAGEHPDQPQPDCLYYWEWNDRPPDAELYRPAWTDAERTHYQIYETVSEGTPIGPAFETLDELAVWYHEHGDPGYGAISLSAAKNFAESGYAPSMVVEGGRVTDGVNAQA